MKTPLRILHVITTISRGGAENHLLDLILLQRQEGIEVTAREGRLRFLTEVASQVGAQFVATAHTADDQAETVLHRIVRGTGIAGLIGIPPARPLGPRVTLIRPLLQLRRQEVRTFLQALGQDARQDMSNYDTLFTRNRLRHEVIPYLRQHINPQIHDALVRLAALAAEAQGVIDNQVERWMRRASIRRDAHAVSANLSVLRRAPRYILCEMFRRLWSEQSWPLQEFGQADWAQLADLVHATKKLQGWNLPGGITVRRSRDRLTITKNSDI